MIFGKGGLMAHFGSNDVEVLLKKAGEGDERIDLVLQAMLYNVAKEIAAMSAVLYGKVDAILLTGGIAYNAECMDKIRERVDFLAPVIVYPGEDELEALALAGLRAIRGEERVKEYC